MSLKYLSICLVSDGDKTIDMGNYYGEDGHKVLFTSKELAEKYGHLVDCPIYIKKDFC